jgi:hypothetical protein
MGILQLIAVGIRIAGRHWRPLLLVSALTCGIAIILDELASLDLEHVVDALIVYDQGTQRSVIVADDAATTRLAWAALTLAGTSLLSALATAGATAAWAGYVQGDYHGRATMLGASLGRLVRRGPVAALAALLSAGVALLVLALGGVIVAVLLSAMPPAANGSGGLGVLLSLVVGVSVVLLAIVLGIRWSLAQIVAVLEPVGPVQALRRSWSLTGENGWRTLGVQFLSGLLVALLSALISVVLGSVIIQSLAADSQAQRLGQVVFGSAVGTLFAPVVPVILTCLYYDLRVRRERLQLELQPDA